MSLLLSFVLGVAGNVLTNVISDLITGRTKAARKAEIERQVEKSVEERLRLRNKNASKEEMAPFVRRAVEEVRVLSELDPDLKTSDEGIELADSVKAELPLDAIQSNAQLLERLSRLNEIIDMRRRQLGIAAAAEGAAADADADDAAADPPEGWEMRPTEAPPVNWTQELDEMQARIKKRREALKGHE